MKTPGWNPALSLLIFTHFFSFLSDQKTKCLAALRIHSGLGDEYSSEIVIGNIFFLPWPVASTASTKTERVYKTYLNFYDR